jgi:predicted RecB family nuclease
MKQRRVCPKGHVYFKSSDCPVCPRCEAARKPAADFLAGLAAPARRALEGAGLTTLAKLARRRESEVAQLHGMGPSALGRLRNALGKAGRGFAKD